MTIHDQLPTPRRGPIAWMTSNRVTPNLMMLVFIFGGLYFSTRVKQEVFPEFELDMVRVSVPYPGSSPEEVEQGIVLSVEEAIRGLEGVKEISAQANEGMGIVTAELLEGVNQQKVYQDIKQEIDRIRTFPEDAEEPSVSLVIRRREVLRVQIYGDASEWTLRELAEQVRDGLLQHPGITQVDLLGARRYEIQVMVNQDNLRTYGLTMQQIADKIRAKSVELPGGHIETKGGEILLRVMERRDWAREFADLPIITTPKGSVIRLGELATVKDGFEDVDKLAYYDNARAVGLSVFRVGTQTPISVSDAAHEALGKMEAQLPPGIRWAVTSDRSGYYRQRLELLLKNASIGLVLVLAMLGLFLEFKLAFWVTLGIPTSFLGSFLFLPSLDVTINMISMFAFIVSLGIVVDDAIVVGENIYEYRKRGMPFAKAAILATQNVAVPVCFSILTNIVAFMPLLFVPGISGKIWKTIPMVVIMVFSISLVEALFILPAHLGHSRDGPDKGLSRWIHRGQQKFSDAFSLFIEKIFAPFLDGCIKFRQVTVALGFAILIIVLSQVANKRIKLINFPRVESDYAIATAVLPFGSSLVRITAVADRLYRHAAGVIAENGGSRLSLGIFTEIEEDTVELRIYLTDPKTRPITTTRLTELWRESVGPMTGLESLRFESDRGGPGSGAALTIELSHRDIDVLDRSSERLADILAGFSNVKDINDGYTPGKQQLNLAIKPEGESLGLTALGIGRQVRNAYYGAEAVRQQRGRNEVRLRVKFPVDRRISEYDLERLLIRTPAGTDVPLGQVARVTRGRSYTSITRRNGRRTVTVTANVEPIGETGQVKEALNKEYLPQLQKDFPGLACGWEGRQADLMESLESLGKGFIIALFVIYAMLAVPFKSYVQPLIVMVAIPFGIVGAVLGHMIMGYNLSVISMMGIVALSGVVVNDSLVLIDYANRLRKENRMMSAFDAIHKAGVRRFRPIFLTTLTTFGGLAPMIFETSRQARFMIPMALSLGYGIIFATVITLVIVPCLYMLLDDVLRRVGAIKDYLAS